MKRALAGGLAFAALSGCAGKFLPSGATVEMEDRYMDCAAIVAEMGANNARLRQLAPTDPAEVTQAITGSVTIPLRWLSTDWPGPAERKTQALQARQQQLVLLAVQRHCGDEPE